MCTIYPAGGRVIQLDSWTLKSSKDFNEILPETASGSSCTYDGHHPKSDTFPDILGSDFTSSYNNYTILKTYF